MVRPKTCGGPPTPDEDRKSDFAGVAPRTFTLGKYSTNQLLLKPVPLQWDHGSHVEKNQLLASPNLSANLCFDRKVRYCHCAARGIGRAIAVALANAGADIMGLDIAAIVSSAVIHPAASEEEQTETRRLVEA